MTLRAKLGFGNSLDGGRQVIYSLVRASPIEDNYKAANIDLLQRLSLYDNQSDQE